MSDAYKIKLRMSAAIEIAKLICEKSRLREGLAINLINSYSFTHIRNNQHFQQALSGKCANYVDGKPLSLYLALRHRQLRINSRGMDILTQALKEQEELYYRNFFVFFERSDANRLKEYAINFIPEENVIVVEISDQLDLNEIKSQIIDIAQTSSPKIVWVMLGSPKQEIISSLISNSLSCPVIGIGGVIDFVTGKVPEAPRILQYFYLEWFFRLIKEPVRLFRRYTVGNLLFLNAIARDFIYSDQSRQKSALNESDNSIEFYIPGN